MILNILTPSRKVVVKEECVEAFLPGVEGQLDVFDQHTNFLTELATGVAKWKTKSGEWKQAAISYGWLEIFDDHINVLADVVEMGFEIDFERAKTAEEKAKLKLAEGGLDDTGFRKHELKLERSLARQMASK